MILLTRDPLDPETLTATVRDGANGGVVTFLGTVRNNTDGRQVLYLEYEAYETWRRKFWPVSSGRSQSDGMVQSIHLLPTGLAAWR